MRKRKGKGTELESAGITWQHARVSIWYHKSQWVKARVLLQSKEKKPVHVYSVALRYWNRERGSRVVKQGYGVLCYILSMMR
jgi:hypothetical protein